MSVYCVNTIAVSCSPWKAAISSSRRASIFDSLRRALLEVVQEVLELADLVGEVECRAIEDVEIERDVRLEGGEVVGVKQIDGRLPCDISALRRR